MISMSSLFEIDSGDSITIKKDKTDINSKKIPAGKYEIIETWEKFYLIKDSENNRYQLPRGK